MSSRISLTVAAVGATVLLLGQPRPAVAVDSFYKGPDGPNWNVNGNWQAVYQGGTVSTVVPRGSGGFNMRAVIGTDNATYGLSKSVDLNVLLPVNNQTIHGLALGSRERTPDTTLAFVNPAPAAGAMVGSLTISGATTVLRNTTGPHAAIGADGSIKVGVEGRGYLTMLGGLLEGTSLSVAGEEVTTGNGTSLLDLRGSSTLTVTGSGTATLGRRIRVEGPNVNFTSGGNLTLQPTNSLTAVITDPNNHSPLKTNANALVGGSLFVEFSGAGATHPVGRTWNLIDAAGSIPGAATSLFNNLEPGGIVNVSGLASPPPVGAAYRVKKTLNPGDNHTLLQLAYEGLLVLRVNRDTGEMALTNPHNAPIEIDSYEIRSPLGSLLPTYKGISGAPAGASGWEKVPLNSETGLAELKSAPFTFLDFEGLPPLTLGTGAGKGFDKLAVADDIANFGTDGEDLEFYYTTPEGPIRGHVDYIGTKFENNLVLRVNPNTGEAFLKNDSHETLTFDGYTIQSSTNALDSANWDGLGGTWAKTDLEPSALSETNLFGSITLDPAEQVAIGDIGAFNTTAHQDGLSMKFILSVGLGGGGPLTGDYNSDGSVDAADYVIWRKTGVGGAQGYLDWRNNFGATGGAQASETTYRTGSIVFDATAGADSDNLAAVPEPGAVWLMLVGVVGALTIGRSRTTRQCVCLSTTGEIASGARETRRGGRNMSKRFGACLMAAIGLYTLLVATKQAAAVPQGIPLVNYDFEDPGPPGTKTYAFTEAGVPIPGAIPGWTFTGPGTETFGHSERLGDSGTEGGGNPGQEMLLSVNDGKAYQIASGFTIQSITNTQLYKFALDAHDIFTIDANGQGLADSAQLTARFFYGAWAEGQRTLFTQAIDLTGDWTRYEFTIAHDSPLLAPAFGALGQTVGVEFTTTSKARNPLVDKSWSGIDNVVMEIAPVLPGDFNGSGTLTTADYDILRANIQKSACTTSPAGIRGCPFEANGEMTGDYVVDLNDFRAFKTLFDAGSGSGNSGGATTPEPSTIILMLLACAAGLGGTRTRRGFNVPTAAPAMLLLLVCGAAFFAAGPVSAELYAYDPFRLPTPLTNPANPALGQYNEWTPPTPGQVEPIPHLSLAGQNPTPFYGTRPNFFEGQWRTAGNAPGGMVHPMSIQYINTPNEGGSARIAPIPNPSYNGETPTAVCGTTATSLYSSCDGRTARFFETPYDDSTNETLYISFIANFGTTTGEMGFRAVEFFPSTSVPTADWSEDRWLDLGYNGFFGYGNPTQQNPATARLGLGLYAQGQQRILTDAPTSYNADGRNHLFVLKFEFSNQNNMDNVLIYMDPASTEEPELANAEFRGLNFTLGALSTVTRYGGTAPTLDFIGDLGSSGIFDELRIGSTFADVLPGGLPCPGDTDGNCVIDLVDYQTIRDNFHRTDAAGPAEGDVARSDGRLGFDGRVDLGDFYLWKRMYEESLSGGGSGVGSTIPEPSTALLLFVVVGFAVGFSGRWRAPCAARSS